MFLDGCTVEEYTRLQVRDQVALAKQQGLKVQVNGLKSLVPDVDTVTEIIRKNEGFEDVTPEMVRKYW